ncbi:mediator complex subunit [Nowakowskiella sp. JEL0407]|nr:mediator complex subunit [Nowakowskiella sp. JEL0407]
MSATVALSQAIERQTQRAYSQLKDLADLYALPLCESETNPLCRLPSLLPEEQKRLLFAHCLHTRSLFLKLVVLVRWAATRSVHAQSAIKSIVPPEPLTDTEKKSTLTHLTDIIQLRLLTYEILPSPLKKKMSIKNGKVIFSVPREFEVSLTLPGPQLECNWKIVALEILVESATNNNSFTNLSFGIPPQQKDLIFRTAQSKLDRSLDSKASKFWPLMNLYNYLHDLALTFKLETLRAQVKSLQVSRYQGLLFADDKNSEKLVVQFWGSQFINNRNRVVADQVKVEHWLEIYIDRGCDVGNEVMVKPEGVDDVAWYMTMGTGKPRNLCCRLVERNKGTEIEILKLDIDTDTLDFEELLSTATRYQAKKITERLKNTLEKSGETRVRDGDEENMLVVEYGDGKEFTVSVEERTGKIAILDADVGGREGFALEKLEEKINQDLDLLSGELKNLNFASMLDQVEISAKFLGMVPVQSIAITDTELTKLLAWETLPQQITYIRFYIDDTQADQFSEHYFMLAIEKSNDGEMSVCIFIISIRNTSLSTNPEIEAKRMSIKSNVIDMELLQKIEHRARIYICQQTISRYLTNHQLPFDFQPQKSLFKIDPTIFTFAKPIKLNEKTCLAMLYNFAKPEHEQINDTMGLGNIFFRIDPEGKGLLARAKIHKDAMDVLSEFVNVVDRETGVLSMEYKKCDNREFFEIVQRWRKIGMLLTLVMELCSRKQWLSTRNMKIESFDLNSITISYETSQSITISWQDFGDKSILIDPLDQSSQTQKTQEQYRFEERNPRKRTKRDEKIVRRGVGRFFIENWSEKIVDGTRSVKEFEEVLNWKFSLVAVLDLIYRYQPIFISISKLSQTLSPFTFTSTNIKPINLIFKSPTRLTLSILNNTFTLQISLQNHGIAIFDAGFGNKSNNAKNVGNGGTTKPPFAIPLFGDTTTMASGGTVPVKYGPKLANDIISYFHLKYNGSGSSGNNNSKLIIGFPNGMVIHDTRLRQNLQIDVTKDIFEVLSHLITNLVSVVWLEKKLLSLYEGQMGTQVVAKIDAKTLSYHVAFNREKKVIDVDGDDGEAEGVIFGVSVKNLRGVEGPWMTIFQKGGGNLDRFTAGVAKMLNTMRSPYDGLDLCVKLTCLPPRVIQDLRKISQLDFPGSNLKVELIFCEAELNQVNVSDDRVAKIRELVRVTRGLSEGEGEDYGCFVVDLERRRIGLILEFTKPSTIESNLIPLLFNYQTNMLNLWTTEIITNNTLQNNFTLISESNSNAILLQDYTILPTPLSSPTIETIKQQIQEEKKREMEGTREFYRLALQEKLMKAVEVFQRGDGGSGVGATGVLDMVVKYCLVQQLETLDVF